jgi:hypothetical protein
MCGSTHLFADMYIRSEIADTTSALGFWDEDNNITGFFTDLIVSR